MTSAVPAAIVVLIRLLKYRRREGGGEGRKVRVRRKVDGGVEGKKGKDKLGGGGGWCRESVEEAGQRKRKKRGMARGRENGGKDTKGRLER